MTETPQRQTPIINHLWAAWLGLLMFGSASLTAYFALTILLYSAPSAGSQTTAQIIGAVLFIAATGLAALFAYRAGNVALAAGLVVGYLLMSLVSAGTCTLLQDPFQGYAMLGGAIYYTMALLGSLVLLVIAAIVNAVIQRRKAP